MRISDWSSDVCSSDLPEFTDEVVGRPDVKAMVEKVNFYVSEEAEKAGYDKMTTIIDIHLKDGRKVSGRADFGKGSPANPMTYDEVADKRSEEHTSELQSLMRISYAVFCLKKKK